MTFLVRECYGSPKISIKFVKIRQNSLKFTPEECYDKVLNEEFKKNLFCKMKNVITRDKMDKRYGIFVIPTHGTCKCIYRLLDVFSMYFHYN
jgi:hypothetical protein